MVKLSIKNFKLMKCNTSKAVEAIPLKKNVFNLNLIRKKLEKQKIIIEIYTPVVLIVKINKIPVSIYDSGKIIVKNISETKKAETIISRTSKRWGGL